MSDLSVQFVHDLHPFKQKTSDNFWVYGQKVTAFLPDDNPPISEYRIHVACIFGNLTNDLAFEILESGSYVFGFEPEKIKLPRTLGNTVSFIIPTVSVVTNLMAIKEVAVVEVTDKLAATILSVCKTLLPETGVVKVN